MVKGWAFTQTGPTLTCRLTYRRSPAPVIGTDGALAASLGCICTGRGPDQRAVAVQSRGRTRPAGVIGEAGAPTGVARAVPVRMR